jgi:hypothetical protein
MRKAVKALSGMELRALSHASGQRVEEIPEG